MTDHQPDLRHYLRVLRRQGWLVALVTALALGGAAAVTVLQTPVYRASIKVVVGQGGGVFQPQFGASVQPFARTMANLFESDVVAQRTIQDLHLKTTPKELLGRVHVSTSPDSSVLDVRYETSNRPQAVPVLAEMGTVFTGLVQKKLGEPRASGAEITATVFDPAHLEPGRVSPRPARNLGIAGVLGLAIGLVLAFVRESLDNRIRGRRDAEKWFGAPVLGALPKGIHGSVAANVAPSAGKAGGIPFEAVSMLRSSLQFLGGGMGGPFIVVTSGLPDEGKTTLVANLGVALASAGSRVICVEADLRRPRLRQYLSSGPAHQGLADVLEGRIDVEDGLVELPVSASANGRARLSGGRLQVLPAGRTHANPADLMTAEQIAHLAEELRGRADYVIVDTPPILVVGDAFPLVRVADRVIVVAREGQTTRETAAAVRMTLERLDVERVGVVLVDWQAGDGSGYGYGYGYEPDADVVPIG